MKVLKLSYDVKAFCSVRLVLGYLSRKLSLHPEKISPDKIAVYINIFFGLILKVKEISNLQALTCERFLTMIKSFYGSL